MAVDPANVGRVYGPFRYEVGREKVREFTLAVAGGVPSSSFPGEPPEGLAAPGPDEIAFPTFAVTFAMRPFSDAVSDPRLGIDLVKLVHGEQAFEFCEVVRPGDVLTTTGTLTRIFEKASMDFVVMETESVNQHGRVAVKATWTAVIRR